MSYQIMPDSLAVFIGRFSPCHIGHKSIFESALTNFKHLLILIGSSRQPRTEKNPWTFKERSRMVFWTIPPELRDRVTIRPIRDKKYDDVVWANQVTHLVRTISKHANLTTIKLIGHDKDDTSWYLHTFPQWGDPVLFPATESLNATDIREILFEGKSTRYLQAVVDPKVCEFIDEFITTSAFDQLRTEYQVINKYRSQWLSAPRPVNFVTVDALVVHPSGHILMGQRKSYPGKGQLALPGGFLELNERAIDGAIRELKEETRIKLPPAVLKSMVVKNEVFDDPSRSSRGRTITHAFLIRLADGPLPYVKGGDDMIGSGPDTMWKRITDLKEEEIFEDHYHMIQRMLGNYIDYD